MEKELARLATELQKLNEDTGKLHKGLDRLLNLAEVQNSMPWTGKTPIPLPMEGIDAGPYGGIDMPGTSGKYQHDVGVQALWLQKRLLGAVETLLWEVRAGSYLPLAGQGSHLSKKFQHSAADSKTTEAEVLPKDTINKKIMETGISSRMHAAVLRESTAAVNGVSCEQAPLTGDSADDRLRKGAEACTGAVSSGGHLNFRCSMPVRNMTSEYEDESQNLEKNPSQLPTDSKPVKNQNQEFSIKSGPIHEHHTHVSSLQNNTAPSSAYDKCSGMTTQDLFSFPALVSTSCVRSSVSLPRCPAEDSTEVIPINNNSTDWRFRYQTFSQWPVSSSPLPTSLTCAAAQEGSGQGATLESTRYLV